MKSNIKSIVVLTVLALLAGAILSFTQLHTRDRIGEHKTAQALMRLGDLVPHHDHARLCEMGIDLREHEIQGYGGAMSVALAFKEGQLLGVRVVSHSETPGFADSLEPENWIGRFAREPVSGIDAVTRATITTSAVLRLVQDEVRIVNTEGSSC